MSIPKTKLALNSKPPVGYRGLPKGEDMKHRTSKAIITFCGLFVNKKNHIISGVNMDNTSSRLIGA